MKTPVFLLAAALGLIAATAAQAQTTPTSTPYGGAVNQTRVPLPNPANPTTNPGTIDQRTPTTTSPTQSGVIGTIDERPVTVPINPSAPINPNVRDERNTRTTAPVRRSGSPQPARRATPEATTVPRP